MGGRAEGVHRPRRDLIIGVFRLQLLIADLIIEFLKIAPGVAWLVTLFSRRSPLSNWVFYIS